MLRDKKQKHKWYPYDASDWYAKQYGAKARRCMNCQKDNFLLGYVNPYTGSSVEGTGKYCEGGNTITNL